MRKPFAEMQESTATIHGKNAIQGIMDLCFASEDERGDHGLVMQAVSQNGLVLENASEELRGDREIVRQAVSQNGLALEFASNELRAECTKNRARISAVATAICVPLPEISHNNFSSKILAAIETSLGNGAFLCDEKSLTNGDV